MPDNTLFIRLKQALNWLKRNKNILQKDVAEEMGMAEASFTRALMRTKERNDEDFVIKFHSVTSQFFSLDYLLYGDGDLTMQEKQDVPKNIPDMSSVFNAALAAKDEAIESLKRELQTKEELIQSLRDLLSTKDQLIAEQKARLVDYRRLIDTKDIFKNYPFQMGVAEDKRQQKHP